MTVPSVRLVCGAALIALLPVLPPVAAPARAAAVPDFSGYWVRPEAGKGRKYYPPATGAGPLQNTDKTGTYMIGDDTNPILKPEAAAAVKAFGDAGRAGKVLLPAWSLCWPTGVPLVLDMAEPVQFLQTPDQITVLYERSRQVRRIYLNVGHSADPAPSWYGESVGHYEGNTLVVDTIGQNTKSQVDRFGTPHSAQLHVVERYTVTPDRKTLNVAFTVEDPVMFTTPWSAHIAYVRPEARHGFDPNAPAFAEVACAENNRNPFGGVLAIPRDDTPDF